MALIALAYHEPSIVTILIQSSFLLASNILGFVLDHVLYCGLVGQVLLGMAWGTPGAAILSRPFEETATQLGYIGLIMIVFEGGLATSVESLASSLMLSIFIALTGIGVPIALSFSLMAFSGATKLQAFAAGAALCSTSLGTTFSLLKATGLTSCRLGTVLTSAAMLDDVVGLIMVQVISNLGDDHSSISISTVVRPIFVSLAFATVIPLTCRVLLKPMIPSCTKWLKVACRKFPSKHLGFSLPIAFVLSTMFLVSMVTGASYAGTSNLFAAYLAGAVTSWVNDFASQSNRSGVETPTSRRPEIATELTTAESSPDIPTTAASKNVERDASESGLNNQSAPAKSSKNCHEIMCPPKNEAEPGSINQVSALDKLPESLDMDNRTLQMYTAYYAPAVEHILKPFFFASIGFSIPISKMFRGPVIWRGLVYALLMAVGKLCCGVWLVRFAKPSGMPRASSQTPASVAAKTRHCNNEQSPRKARNSLPRPKSLYPASILGCAMVARGEIGFLISALAASNGIFTGRKAGSPTSADDSLDSEIYLIVTWAILLCTIAGPLALGVLTRRVKRLQKERSQRGEHGTKEDPLGPWGVG